MHHAGRLRPIAGEQAPEVSDSLTAEECLRIRRLISSYYSVARGQRARSTLRWLASHGYEDQARNAVVVSMDQDATEEHLAGICRALIAVPHDRGVTAEGDLVTVDVLKPVTRRAYKEIVAAIVDGTGRAPSASEHRVVPPEKQVLLTGAGTPADAYPRTMINLMDGGRRRPRPPKRQTLEMAGLTALSVAGAAILLPVIGLKALAGRLPFVKNASGKQQVQEDSYLIN